MQNEGEIWERNYRRRKLLIKCVVLVLAALTPLVIKVAGDESVLFPAGTWGPGWHLPLALRIGIAVLFFGILGLGARWNWVVSDEVRRSHILSFWAAIGISVGITFIGFMLFGHDIPAESRLRLAFLLPMGMGSVFAIARWFRDGFVW
jgi:hypothetical protein